MGVAAGAAAGAGRLAIWLPGGGGGKPWGCAGAACARACANRMEWEIAVSDADWGAGAGRDAGGWLAGAALAAAAAVGGAAAIVGGATVASTAVTAGSRAAA